MALAFTLGQTERSLKENGALALDMATGPHGFLTVTITLANTSRVIRMDSALISG